MVERQIGARGPSSAADWIFTDGRVLTFDPRRPRATAVAVVGGRVAAVGARGDVKAWRGRRTQLIGLTTRLTMVGGDVVHHA
jgi:hypothetical protein